MIEAREAIPIVQKRLSVHRFQHSMNVANTAAELAHAFGVDIEKAFLAGILHDYAKNLTAPELIIMADTNGLIDNDMDRETPDLLHAPVGAWLLERELGLKDHGILEAVRVHTLGSLNMSILDKLIFLADMIEPDRQPYPDLEGLRHLSFRDLDKAMLLGIESTIRYCLDSQMILHSRTIMVRNNFLRIVARR
ncbi:MAG: bis(5'-nucleosyl)-tetraphosphatase (symmetrical) YqeK [Syntrophomonas sp.]|nr:bis(5'-nucleosyl)-tetraphosphatase (symmetrical) YqeK [Syntrophomonas sp.]